MAVRYIFAIAVVLAAVITAVCAEPVEYTIRIKTASIKHAGTDDTVYIDIVGSKGRTQKRKLDARFRDDFEKGQLDKFKISAVNLGDLRGVILTKIGSDGWAVSYVEIDGPSGQTDWFDGKDQQVTQAGLKIPKSERPE